MKQILITIFTSLVVVLLVTMTGMPQAAYAVVTDFLDLADTPASYTGHGNEYIRVKATEDELTFSGALIHNADYLYSLKPVYIDRFKNGNDPTLALIGADQADQGGWAVIGGETDALGQNTYIFTDADTEGPKGAVVVRGVAWDEDDEDMQSLDDTVLEQGESAYLYYDGFELDEVRISFAADGDFYIHQRTSGDNVKFVFEAMWVN